jgi:hypothetical protein
MVMSPSRPCFVRVIDTSFQENNGEWIAKRHIEAIEVEALYIMQVISGIACSCKVTNGIIESVHDHIFESHV